MMFLILNISLIAFSTGKSIDLMLVEVHEVKLFNFQKDTILDQFSEFEGVSQNGELLVEHGDKTLGK